ncbi:phosphoethanolamine transferase [Vibrio sp. ZSDZ65]|uniref:Phosphoethanolamine transferase n=1 Tax=Vibrio qingdaonensis TaxID=2829491 RepID=A0A9X3CR79_9VIBR|nr:phosphoethanolamine transferase [Vibrio qingdaonensis]MCW8348057.1 phosphoethanolamine transferase [Vibrio qingdaonensis]
MPTSITNYLSKSYQWILKGTLVSTSARSLLIGIVILLAEVIVRARYDVVPIGEPYWIPIFSLVFGLLISYARSLVAALILTIFLVLGYAIQFFSISNYGYFITPIKLWLLFEKFLEVIVSGRDAVKTMGVTIFALTLVFISFFSLVWTRKNIPKKSHWVSIIAVAVVLFYPIRQTINSTNTLGRLPAMYHSTIKNTFYTWGFFTSRTVPEELLGHSKVKPFSSPSPAKTSNGLADNIVVIMGESLSSKYMSAFDYPETTTPWLDEQKSLSNTFFAEGFSGGLFTDVSLPFFFNSVAKPNGVKQIGSGNSNLFRLAKENGYTTHFYSTQANYGLSLMSLVGLQWVDNYDDSFSLTNNSYQGVLDMELMNWLKKVDLNKKNLIVLHQTGSHMPYADRTPDDYKPFGSETDYAEYMNSVHYTDDLIRQIQQYIVDHDSPSWALLMTSDHGQYVTKNTAGHGNFLQRSNYTVPIYLSSGVPDIIKLAQTQLGQCKSVFQIQLSHYLAEIMGFSYPNNNGCKSGYIAGSRLTGDNGFLHIKQEKDNESSELVYE